MGGASLAPGSVPIRNGIKLVILTPCIRQNIMSTVLKPLSLLLLRTSALRTPNWIRPISQSVGTEPSWCRRRHLEIRRINSTSNTTVILQERASGDEDSAGELYLSDSCVKVPTLGPVVFNSSSLPPQQLQKVTGEEPGLVLRVTVDGGGCSGFQYKIDLDTKISSDDK